LQICWTAGPTGFDVKVTVEIPYRYAAFGATLINNLARSTRVLKSLVLQGLEIHEDECKLLCNRLTLNQSVTKLALIGCCVSEEGKLEFDRFVQTKVNRDANKLKKLHFDCHHFLGIPPISIGSALHTLQLGQSDYLVLFEQLASNDSIIQLRRLWLTEWLQPSVLVPLNRYLTQTSTLQDLRIVLSRTRTHFHVLAPAFRANGSLVRV
jgi:hypothetical protein